MRISEDTLKASGNNFTLVRLILASSVIISHSYLRMFGLYAPDPFVAIFGKPVAAFAVDGFFFLSGFLVYASLLRSRNLIAFGAARLSRLWPGLFVAIMLTVAFGAFLTNANGINYLKGDTTRFIVSNLSLSAGYFNLTGVTCGGFRCNVNGSLWTIPWEARCYAMIGLLFIVGLWREGIVKMLIFPLSFLGAVLFHYWPSLNATRLDGAFFYLNMADRLVTVFIMGMAAYAFRDQIRLSWRLLFLLFILMMIEQRLDLHLHIDALFTGYAVLCLGILTAKDGAISGRWPDYSYGMYIYAFPIMMLLAANFYFEHWLLLAACNFLATLPLAAASWHFVEKPALDWAKRRKFGQSKRLFDVASETTSQQA